MAIPRSVPSRTAAPAAPAAPAVPHPADNGNGNLITVLGTSPAFRRAMDLARRVAPTDASVFITGESGSGKELIAQFIHHHSRRSGRSLIVVNCALPEARLESELFGHCKGAFTGAVRDKAGLLEAANGGTLLLDEPVEMSRPIQAKLLRFLQDGVVRRVGSDKTDATVNVRFVCCSDRDEGVESRGLREDLYYRLRVVPIHVIPLRDRPSDIKLLADHFLALYWHRHRGPPPATPLPRFSDDAARALRARPWKGNVRELQNVIEHMVVLLEPGEEIGPHQIPLHPQGRRADEEPGWTPPEISVEEPYYVARERLVSEFELHYLTQVLKQCEGNMSRAARAAGMDRTTLYRLLGRHGLDRNLMSVGERVALPAPATSDASATAAAPAADGLSPL